MRRPVAYLAHPARLAALGALGALALTMLMLAGRPEAPPEAEAAAGLTIAKVVVGADVSTSFTSTAAAPSDSFSLMNGEQHVITGVDANGDSAVVTENVPAGYELTGIVCTLAGGGPLVSSIVSTGNPNTVGVTVQGDEDVVCTFTNEEIPPAIINIVKNAAGGDATFNFTSTIPDDSAGAGVPSSGGAFSLTTTGSTATETFVVQVPATGLPFVVTEALPPVGWEFTSLNCAVINNASGNASGGSAGSQGMITVGGGDEVTCTYVNTKTSSITIVKDTDPDRATDFTFDITMGAGPTTLFTLDDDADNTLSNMMVFNDAVPGAWTVTETNIQGNYRLTNISCTGCSSFTYQSGGGGPSLQATTRWSSRSRRARTWSARSRTSLDRLA
jgi:hypothetical protein